MNLQQNVTDNTSDRVTRTLSKSNGCLRFWFCYIELDIKQGLLFFISIVASHKTTRIFVLTIKNEIV